MIENIKPVQEILSTNFSQWFIDNFNVFTKAEQISDGEPKGTKNCVCFDSKIIEYQGIKIYYEMYIEDNTENKFDYDYSDTLDDKTKSYLSDNGINKYNMIYTIKMTFGIDKEKYYTKEDLCYFGYDTEGNFTLWTECQRSPKGNFEIIKDISSFLRTNTEYSIYDRDKKYSRIEEIKSIVSKKLEKYDKINKKKAEEKLRISHGNEIEGVYNNIITNENYKMFLTEVAQKTKEWFKYIDKRYKELLNDKEELDKFKQEQEKKNIVYPRKKRYATDDVTITLKDDFKKRCLDICNYNYGNISSEYLLSDNKKEFIEKYLLQQKEYFYQDLRKNLIEIKNAYEDSKDYSLVSIGIGVHQTADIYLDIHSSSNPNKIIHIQTFGAGGNNIQKYHVRSKINFVQDKEKYHED